MFSNNYFIHVSLYKKQILWLYSVIQSIMTQLIINQIFQLHKTIKKKGEYNDIMTIIEKKCDVDKNVAFY